MVNLAWWLLERSDPESPAVWDRGRWHTYRALGAHVRRVARYLDDRRAAGTFVLLCGENSFASIAAYLGVLYAGAIPVPLPPLGDAVLRAVVDETAARLALVDASNVMRIRSAGVEAFDYEAALGEELALPVEIDAGALALLLYTSGSTGRPRGVMLSARNLQFSADAIHDFLPLTATDRALVTLPFYYCYGLSVLHTHLRAGAAVVLASSSFPNELVDIAAATAVTGIPGVPSLFELVVERSTLATRKLPALRYAMISGGRASERLVAHLRAAVPGVRVYLRYGITEVTAAVSCLSPDLVDTKPGSIGRGLAGARLAVELADGTPVAPGSRDTGEVVVRGPHVALGYFGDPDETTQWFRRGGFCTGDLARVDAEGFVFLTGRERDFVKTAGHRVSPHEVEDVIAELPDASEVAVVGIAHAVRGEALAAFVVPRTPALDAAAVRCHCEQQLPAWKVPTEVRLVPELPKLDNGKLDRRALAAAIVKSR